MLSANQCRMARAALGLGIRDLAHLADVSPNTVARLERGENLHPRTLEYVQGAFEAEGVTFLSTGKISAWGGEGVRMAASATSDSRMALLFRAFRELPDLRTKPEKAYSALVDIFAQIIAMMRSDNRVPDAWERISLRDAAVALNRSDLFSAAPLLWKAITPPDNQAPDYPIAEDEVASVAECDVTFFDTCIATLRHRGYIERWT